MKRVFLIHGWEGRPDNHWFPWLKRELEARYIKVFAPAMPNPTHPNLDEWIMMIRDWVGEIDPETFFVGHSLGCIAILKYLERTKINAKFGTAVFVGGFKDDINEKELFEFTRDPLDFEKIKGKGNFVSIASDNDEQVTLSASMALAHALDSKIIVLKGKGHFCKSDGVVSLPEVLEALL